MARLGSEIIARHLSAALGGFGSSSVVAGAVETRGRLLDEEVIETDRSGDLVRVRRWSLLLRAGDFETLPRQDSTVTVDETDYLVRDARVVEDGTILRLEVVPA